MDFAALYGRGFGGGPVRETASADASGPPGSVSAPAFSLVAVLLVLIGIRVLWELAE
jgi:hypothetical protein